MKQYGGMRSAREATRKLPRWTTAAASTAEVLEQTVAEHKALFDDILENLGTDKAADIPDDIVNSTAEQIARGDGL